MSSLHFIRRIAMLGALLASLAAISVGGQATAQTPERPNIVLINADDLALGDYQRIAALRNLGGRGTFFKNSYVSTALCCPSRATTLTGMYVHNHGVRRHVGDGTGHDAFRARGHESHTFALWLQEAGYRTALVGKYMNRYDVEDAKPPGWDEWYAADTPARSWRLNENGQVNTYPQDRSVDGYRHWEDVLGDKAVRFIKTSDPASPLLLYYNPHAPHSPEVWPPRHDGSFSGAALPTSGGFDERDVSDKPRYIRQLARVSDAQRQAYTKKHRARLRSMLSVVDQIKRIETALRAEGKLDNTVFIFTSDNGYHMGQHRLPPGKQTPYETDHRVPLAVWGKGIPQLTRNHLVSNVDLAATVAQLAGVAGEPQRMDGKSLIPVLRGGVTPGGFRKWLLVEAYWGADVKGAVVPPTYSGIRTLDKRMFLRYATGERELYNLDTDPNQLTNNISKAPADLKSKLDTKRAALYSCKADSCRTAEK